MTTPILDTTRAELSFRNYNEALQRLVTDDGISASDVVKMLHNPDGIFFVDEGPLHDYKREYPFSSTDNLFGSILRLICAMHNSYGGAIVFGVHNEQKIAGKNKVIVDPEKINRKLRETLSAPLEIRVAHVDTPSGAVQLVLIPPRPAMTPPIYPTKSIAEYPAGTIYLRKGAEVLRATGSDLSFLYGSREAVFTEGDTGDHTIAASLPPSPATIQEFVGRFTAIEKITDWVRRSRDPRLFLWGQGGSGKSTIAYEFACMVAHHGRLLTNRSGKQIDRVIFISGKATYLNPHTGKVEVTVARDFETAEDIFKSILILSGWDSAEHIEAYDYDTCVDALEGLFDIESQIIVLDDIDTLTTAKKDGGMEELFLMLSRSKSGTKILYTQRGFPSFAPNAAVEVPSLNDEEMSQFVKLCSASFNVAMPDEKNFALIAEHSERRPLAIETLMGMRRITSDYPAAFKRWKEKSGEARLYLFSREYQQLGRDDRARYLLAALSIMDGPQSFDTLRDILQFSPDQLQDAIAEARDMFLRISRGSAVQGDLYSIGSATRLFITEMSEQLDRFPSIQARVQHFRSKNKGTPSAFIPLIERANRMIRNGNSLEAVKFLTKADLPESFKEHPEVKALLGKAFATTSPQNVLEARKCFDAAFTLGYRHYQMYLTWLDLEKSNRTEISNGITICEKILSSDGFDGRTRANFRRRLARYQAMKANDVELASPEQSTSLRSASILNNVQAFGEAASIDDPSIITYKERAEDSVSIGLRRHLSRDDFSAFFDLLEAIVSQGVSLNELAAILSARCEEIVTRPASRTRAVIGRLQRLSGRIRSLPNKIANEATKELLCNSAKISIAALSEK